MTPTLRLVAAIGLILTACAPTVSGPGSPRPVPERVIPTVDLATTTTAAVADQALQAGPECPTEFCVVYHIDPRAEWSDGMPVTGDDFAYTVSVDRTATTGSSDYSAVAGVEVLDERTVMVAFEEPYGAWQTLFGRVFRTGEDPSSIAELSTTGPFRFVGWEEGDRLTLARDPQWWSLEDPLSGAPLGDVAEITFVFIDDDEMLGALADGEADVIVARPDQPMAEEVSSLDGVDHTLSPGPFWEHIDFHHDHPLLSQRWAREAISLAIDREEILDRTIRSISPESTPLDSTVFMAGTESYEPHYDVPHDPERAEQILLDNGCARGGDGIHVCDGIEMSFVWASTNDDPARREIFESAREDLAAVGIALRSDLRSPSAFVTRDFLFGGPDVWQLINFSWRARPDPLTSNSTYLCGGAGDLNVNRYCSEQVESLVRSTERITDPVERAGTYNRADRRYLEDRALIPLYQKPTLMAWTSEVQGPEPNYTLSSDLWNVASWTGKESIVVALTSEPADMNPLSEADDSANVILGALMYGAFGMSPSHAYVPALVESVDVIEARP